jgi:ribosomal protein S18 acetylase RimI-like enzyme
MDLQSISRLQQQWSDEDIVYGFVPESEEQLEAHLNPYLLVAESGNEMIGFISGSICLSNGTAVIPEGEIYLEIESLYIKPEYRGQGAGSKLIARLISDAKNQGVTYASLYSAVKDIKSTLKFYKKHDFQSWYVQMFKKL